MIYYNPVKIRIGEKIVIKIYEVYEDQHGQPKHGKVLNEGYDEGQGMEVLMLTSGFGNSRFWPLKDNKELKPRSEWSLYDQYRMNDKFSKITFYEFKQRYSKP